MPRYGKERKTYFSYCNVSTQFGTILGVKFKKVF